ncbi:hypothetical protein EGR_10056 [Echinococcus granulosus]|uniref:Uncharacterized protein n=1 Tax=Echinococcus granulosus TaxID=6210 RepID=W6UNX0_ECHGR|nr:hypothetical protein EGR_10056 [Echinococcus granulosus]EUB55089.1 hypothetical protein EGR_10056 [Echinococcus granulosus]
MRLVFILKKLKFLFSKSRCTRESVCDAKSKEVNLNNMNAFDALLPPKPLTFEERWRRVMNSHHKQAYRIREQSNYPQLQLGFQRTNKQNALPNVLAIAIDFVLYEILIPIYLHVLTHSLTFLSKLSTIRIFFYGSNDALNAQIQIFMVLMMHSMHNDKDCKQLKFLITITAGYQSKAVLPNRYAQPPVEGTSTDLMANSLPTSATAVLTRILSMTSNIKTCLPSIFNLPTSCQRLHKFTKEQIHAASNFTMTVAK